MPDLKPGGKPMRVLRALEGRTDEANPITEYDVWRVLSLGDMNAPDNYYEALATLVQRGLAVRTGRRGGYQWYITQAGRDKLKETT